MGKGWHSAQAMKRLATALLATALAGIAVTYVANQKSVAIQGPSALQAVGAETVWLGVGEELWILDREGRRRGVHSARLLGFSQAVSNIVPAPAQQVLLSTGGDRHWLLVDRSTLVPARRITPQWPPDLADQQLRAVHLAVSPEGDIAAATGGQHAVLLFDRDGRLKARTAPGTYRFTNGLWWSAEGWWTTDTSRFALHLLDSETLAVKQTLKLQALPAGYPYLGGAVASQGRPEPDTSQAPIATLSRVGHWMEPGHVVDVFPDGSQALFNLHPFAQLRDIAWFDGQVRASLRQLREERRFWRTLGSRYALAASALLLLAGIASYARHRRLAVRARVASREGGQAASAPPRELARQRLRIYGVPLAVRLAVFAFALFVLFPMLHLSLLGPTPADPGNSLRLLLLCVLLPALGAALWQQWRHERLSAQDRFEPALNQRAIAWLRDHDHFDRVRLEGEVARESVFVTGWRRRWLLVTNRRVLLFAASARERLLLSEWPRRAVVYAGSPAHAPGGDRPSPWLALLRPAPNLALTLTTGTTLALRCASGATARRAAELLMASPAMPEETVAVPGSLTAFGPRRWHEVLASFLVPGTGQWLQGRFTTGAVLFTAALLLAIFEWWPVAWALHGPKMEVSGLSVAWALGSWMLVALVASSDAWHFSTTRRLR